jgi:hypothetical protein
MIQVFREVTINRLRNLSPILKAESKLSFRYDDDDDDDDDDDNVYRKLRCQISAKFSA